MKRDKVIIYDDSCPLCTWYTGAFTRTGLLDKNGRQSFSAIEPAMLDLVDPQRSKNEIPLVDRETGSVVYGLEALLEIIGTKYPLLASVANLRPIKSGLKRLYRLVSYNRRVIVAASHSGKGFDCTPDFNRKYRTAFMLIALVFTTAMLVPLHRYVLSASILSGADLVQLQAAHFALVSSNICIASFFERRTAYEYLGQVAMLAVIATLLVIPLLAINYRWHFPIINNLVLAAVLLFILAEYFRRMQFAGILQHYRTVLPLNLFFLILFLIYLIG